MDNVAVTVEADHLKIKPSEMEVAPPPKRGLLCFLSYKTVNGFLNYQTDSCGPIMHLER